MAEEKVIIELDIKMDKAIEDTVALKKAISDQKKELKELKEVGDENSEAYVLLNAQLKANEKQLSNNQAQLASMATLQKEELGTLEAATARNSELRLEKLKLNLTTEDGKKRLQEINAEMDANNKLIKDSGNAAQQQAANIGNYPDKIEMINTSLNGIPGAAGGAVQGFVAMGKAAWAFVANPIGLTIAAIVGSLMLLKKSLSSTEEGQNKMNKITTLLGGALDALLKVLKPLAMFLADYVIVYFETLGKVAEKAMSIVSNGLKMLGFDKAAAAVDNFGASVKETMKATAELADAEAELQKVQRQSEKIQLDYQKAAEKQRQIRDDESKSFNERVGANEQLNVILQEQLKAEMAIANQALKVAELRIKAEGESTEALDKQAEALTKISDIQERITGQESEYLANVNSLRKDAAAMEKERQDKIAKEKEEATKLELERQKKLVDEKLALLDVELREYNALNKEKLSQSELLNQELIDSEVKRLAEINNLSKESLTIQLENNIITTEEYNVTVLEMDIALNDAKVELTKQFEEQEKQRKLEAYQYQYQLDQELLATSMFGEFEAKFKGLEEQERLEQEFARKTLLTEESKQAAAKKIRDKYDKAEKQIKLAKFQSELSLAGDFAKNIASIAGENTKVGKAASVAATTISTIQGGVAAFTGMASAIPGPVGIGLGIAAAAAALVSGYKSVEKILSVNSGLPGDGTPSVGGGGASAPAVSVTAPTLPQSVNPSLGQGIISRQVDNNSGASMKMAFSEALSENPLQPTLVTNDVTLNQSAQLQQSKTQNI
jgi:hypothetical protein